MLVDLRAHGWLRLLPVCTRYFYVVTDFPVYVTLRLRCYVLRCVTFTLVCGYAVLRLLPAFVTRFTHLVTFVTVGFTLRLRLILFALRYTFTVVAFPHVVDLRSRFGWLRYGLR